jgi:hypothetical protein
LRRNLSILKDHRAPFDYFNPSICTQPGLFEPIKVGNGFEAGNDCISVWFCIHDVENGKKGENDKQGVASSRSRGCIPIPHVILRCRC